MKAISELFHGVLNKKVSAIPLAAFRIVFSLALLIEIGQTFYFRHLLFDPIPYEEVSRIPAAPLLVFWWAAAWLLLLGYKTRYAAIINYVMSVCFLGIGAMNFGYDWHVDSLVITCAILFLFAPVDQVLSVRAIMDRTQLTISHAVVNKHEVSHMYTVILVLIIAAIYVDSIFYKLSSPMYLSGLGFWAPASLPYNTVLDISAVLDVEVLAIFAGYFALSFELVFVFIVWFDQLRRWIVVLGIMFHLCIAIVFPLPVFSMVMIAMFLGILPGKYYHTMGSWLNTGEPKLLVLYDVECPLCRRTQSVLESLDVRKAIRWKALQKEGLSDPASPSIEERNLLFEMHAVDQRIGAIHRGYDSYVRAFSAMGWLAPLSLVLRSWPIRRIGEQVYISVARRREQDGCSDEIYTFPNDSAYQDSSGRLDMAATQKATILAFVCLLIGSLFIIHFASPFYRKYFPEGRDFFSKAAIVAGHYKKAVYPWTGFSTHAVFVDDHFAEYRSQLMLVYEGGGEDMPLPIVNDRGQVSYYNTARQWILWTFRTVRPLRVSSEDLEKNVKRFVLFWAYKNNVDLSEGRIVIRQRQVEVSLTKWIPELLSRNLKTKWTDVGEIGLKQGEYKVLWSDRMRLDSSSSVENR